MIGSILIEQKAAALFLFSSMQTRFFRVERATSINKRRPICWFPGVIASLASGFQSRTILFRWMKIEKVAFIQTNRSIDISDPIKLAFRVFIYSKMEHTINKIRRNLYTSGKPRI